jgi:hypothetical protein
MCKLFLKVGYIRNLRQTLTILPELPWLQETYVPAQFCEGSYK